MAEVADLIHRIDTPTSAAVNEVRIIQLKHSSAQEVATIILQAIGAVERQPHQPARRRRGDGLPAAGTAAQHEPAQPTATADRPALGHAPLPYRRCRGAEALELRHSQRRSHHGRRPIERPDRLRAAGKPGTARSDHSTARRFARRRGADQGVYHRQRRRQELAGHAGYALRAANDAGRPTGTADDADDGLGRREHAGALAIRHRHAHQQHYRRSGRRPIWTWSRRSSRGWTTACGTARASCFG